MDFMNIPLFDEDFYKMAFLFFTNLFFLTIIIRWFYYGSTPKKNYLFTYYLIGLIVFFLCFTLKKYKLDIGLAIGLFAIFGIIRYRTESIPIKEMTYLFIVIGVSLMNAFVNKKMSFAEIIFANSAIVFTIGIIEKVWNLNYEITKEIAELKSKMKKSSENLEFEEAAKFRDKIKRLQLLQLQVLDGSIERES